MPPWQSPGKMLVVEKGSKYCILLADTSVLCAIVIATLYQEIATGLTALAMTYFYISLLSLPVCDRYIVGEVMTSPYDKSATKRKKTHRDCGAFF